MSSLESEIGQFAAIAVVLAMCFFAAFMPLFYFALYRNEGDLSVPLSMRRVAATAAAVALILVLAAIPGWIASFGRDSVLVVAGRPWTEGDTSIARSDIANVANALLLLALFRLAGYRCERDVAVSDLLRVMTKMALGAGVIVVLGCVVGLAATPWVYVYIRDRLLEAGHSNSSWTFARITSDRVRTALALMYVYAAPFIVWRSARARATTGSQENRSIL